MHGLFLLAAASIVPLGLDLYMPVPESNPLTPEKVALGRRLFHDRRLSRDGSLSCASCHDPRRAFTDGRAVAQGVGGRKGARNAPTLINRGYGASHFWDGRAPTLEKQVLEPIFNPAELALTPAGLEARLKLPAAEVALALASYLRTIRSGDSRFDRHLSGATGALTPQEQLGLEVFSSKANCWRCHAGSNFSDEQFHNTGVAWRDGRLLDQGRFAVTGKPEDRGAFKTPTLREVSLTAPYMHDGSLATLHDVIEYYNRGGNPDPELDPGIRRLLGLSSEEKSALVAFLHSLSGRIQEGR